MKGELGMTRVVRDGYVSPMFCVLDMHRGCTSGSSVSAARTIRGVDVANKKKLGMEVRGSGEAEHSRRGRGRRTTPAGVRGRARRSTLIGVGGRTRRSTPAGVGSWASGSILTRWFRPLQVS